MRLLSSSWLLLGLGSLAAARSTAPVYLFEPNSPPQQASKAVEELSPETARLTIARRLGLSQFHTLEHAEDGIIPLLERFGGKKEQLFGKEEGHAKPAAFLLMVEGVESADDLLPSSKGPSFSIANPPDASANEKLISDLEKQIELVHAYEAEREPFIPEDVQSERQRAVNALDSTSTSDELLADLRTFADMLSLNSFGSRGGNDRILVLHLRTLENIINKEGSNSKAYKTAVHILSNAFKSLSNLASANEQSTTLVLMPPSSSTISKRSTNPYGTYDLPTRRQHQAEALLSSEAPAPPPQSPPSSPASAANNDNALNPLQQNAAAAAAAGACYTSLSSCESHTNNCSSHGTCTQSRTDCYTCACTPSVRTNADGTKKTTVWVGAACQRKDISMPFLLLTGFTIFLVGAVAWGISLLASMGSEELPSVLGAGVGGVRPK